MTKKENYSPLYFLASLGAGGLSVSFFMYLMFLTEHKNTPIPTFNTLYEIVLGANSNIFLNIMIFLSILFIIFLAYKHIALLIWNLKQYFEFRKTDAFIKMKSTNAEVTLMALPLTLAMTVNVFFILGALFIPNLWSVVEYLFPLALLAFSLIGYLALKIFSEYFIRLITQKGNADFVENNNLSQLLSVFAFAMIAVGFSASSAMSHNALTVIFGIFGSVFFATMAFSIGLLKIIVGFKAILKHGLDEIASPSLWIMIPILTLIGITFLRNFHGLETFGTEISNGMFIVLTTIILSLQLSFGYIGYKVMKSNKYFEHYVNGKEKNPGTYALICPGVALVVFLFFFLHLGLVKSGVLEKFGIVYFILLLPIILLQIKTFLVMLKLNKKFF